MEYRAVNTEVITPEEGHGWRDGCEPGWGVFRSPCGPVHLPQPHSSQRGGCPSRGGEGVGSGPSGTIVLTSVKGRGLEVTPSRVLTRIGVN